MRYYSLLLSTLAVAITRVSAQAIDTEDVASSCQTACAPVIAASDACEELESDEDAGDWVCVCGTAGISTAISECLACVQSTPVSSGDDNDDDDDGGDVLSGLLSCGVSAAAPSSAAAGGTSIASVASTVAGSAATGGGTVATVADSSTQAPASSAAESSAATGGAAGTSAVDDSGTQSATSGGGNAAASPSTTAGPSQGADDADDDLGGSLLTVITATIGSGDSAMVATLTSVVPGPVVTANEVEQQLGNEAVGAGVPVVAAAIGFAVALL